MRITKGTILSLVAVLALAAAVHGWLLSRHGKSTPVPAAEERIGHRIETAHYTIGSTALRTQTASTGEAIEKLHAAFTARFANLPQTEPRAKLQLRLYGTRAEFRAYNRQIPWAEALYVPPECRAYVADGPNPYHWMLHEATHQLSREVLHFQRARWIDEGLASYFGASRIDAGGLHPGTMDPNTYPIWWLTQFRFSGDVEADVRSGRVIGLRDLIADTGPPKAPYVNLYYIEYWSLAHFLLHHDNGRHAKGFERLLANGATVADFEREIGPIDAVQAEWYDYLQARRADLLRQGDVVLVTP